MGKLCGWCARAGDGVAGHCGWCQCCSANRTGNVGGGRSPAGGEQRASGCLMVPHPVAWLIATIARQASAYRAARLNRYAEL